MPHNLIITGVGGQGNVIASQIVGTAAVNHGFKVTIGETFGLSQRGGPVMSHVRISRDRTHGPLIPSNMAHFIVGLEPLETLRVLRDYGNEETTYVVNSRPIHPLNVIAGDVEYPEPERIREALLESGGRLYWLDATTKAVELGAPILLNMIMLGGLGGLPDFPLGAEDFKGALKGIFPASKLEVNYRALDVGASLVQENEN